MTISFAEPGQGISPSPRAAASSCQVDELQMVVYGGATGGKFLPCAFVVLRRIYIVFCVLFCLGGSLASDDLYLLDLRNGDA